MSVSVFVNRNNVDLALDILNKRMIEDGVLKEYKARQSFKNPHDIARQKELKLKRRRKIREKRREQEKRKRSYM